jgi:hypothetical protein
MPTLPKTKVSGLMHVKPGSLVSLRNNAGKLVFGFCVTTTGYPDDPPELALVVLSPVEGGIVASAVPNRGVGSWWMVNGNTRVIDHGLGYSIHVNAKDWDGDLSQRHFATTDAGLLLLSEGDGLRLAVSIPWAGGCDILNLNTWVLGKPGTSLHMAAKTWRLSLPSVREDDVEWPLLEAPATPDEVIEAINKQ